MSKEALKIISSAMASLGLNYKFLIWKGKPEYPYWVGEYQEVPNINEDGMQETAFILTGFSRGEVIDLENDKEKIIAYFGKVGGHTVTTAKGAAVAVFYSDAFVVPTGDAELQKMQINLTIKEWSVK